MIALEPGQQWLPQFRLLKELVPKSDNRPHIWLAEKHGAAEKVVLKFLRSGPPSPLLVRRLADWRATQVRWFMPLLGVHTSGEQMALELPFIADDSAQLRGAAYPRWSIWLEQVIDVVLKLHRDGFVHGDIKLANIRRDAQSHPILADPWLPGDGKSPYTASPERLAGGPISVQDDLYSIGALMHELATGYPPRYPGLDPAKPPAPRHEMPASAIEAMNALLSPTPAKRPSLVDVQARLAPLNNTDRQSNDAPKLVVSNPPRAARPVSSAAPAPAPAATPPPPPPSAQAAPKSKPAPPAAAPAMSRPEPKPERLSVPSVVMIAAADAKVAALAAQNSTRPPTPAAPPTPPTAATRSEARPVPPAAPSRISVSDFEIRPPVNDAFEPAPLHAGSPTWVRPSDTGVSVNSRSPFQSRASVWRWPVILTLIAAAVAVFVWLPEEVKRSAVDQVSAIAARNGIQLPAFSASSPSAATPPKSAAQAPAPDKDFRKLADAKLTAEQSRDKAAEMEQGLRADGAAIRNIPSFIAAAEARTQGLAAFEQRDFAKADADFRAAITGFQTTRAAIPQLHATAMAAGETALSQCQKDQAITEFRYALALVPHDEAAKEGVTRAQVCEEVFAHVNAGAKAEENGDKTAAKKEYEAALYLDPKSSSAQAALNKLTGDAGNLEYSRQVAAALENLRKHRYSAAATAIAAADKIKPNRPEVQDLSQQLSDVHSNERLQALRTEAAEDERAERWAEALDAYRAMLAVDETLVLAREGARRSEERMKLDAEFASYIDNPDRLAAEEVRTAAGNAMARARLLSSRGHRIETQMSQVGVLLSQFDAPVNVDLNSDGLTHVVIYRVGDLGKFNDRAVSLKPGKYTFVGSRLGYRDVRQELEIAPGQKGVKVEIHCEEQI